MYSAPASPGYWYDTYFKRDGTDIVSLKLHLAKILSLPRPGQSSTYWDKFLQETAGQFQPEATDQSVVDDLANRLGIDVAQPNIGQPVAFRGWSQASWASGSSPRVDRHPEEDCTGNWPDYHLDRVPFIGAPRRKFEMRDAKGRVQQIIGGWPMKCRALLMLSFTLWYQDQNPPNQTWKLARSAIKTCPYGLSSALMHQNATIVIDDDLSNVDIVNPRMIERHASAPPLVFLAWPRGLDRTTPADTDWSPLRGRQIVCAVGNDRDSFIHALELNDQLLSVGTGAIEFVLPKNVMDANDGITVDYEGGDLRGVRKSIDEIKLIAKQQFGISPNNGAAIEIKNVWTIGDDTTAAKDKIIMTPWLESATITVLYSDPGVGKSWFALLIIHALATGGNLLGRFRARSHFHCLYLAGEAGDKICRRIEDIHAAMPRLDAAANIEVYPRPSQNVGKLNLERAEGWKAFETFTDKADVIVIDHLTAFTVGHNSPESWSRLHSQLLRYTQQGKTILLLHHAGKSGQQRGTSILDADIDQKIHLTRLAKVANGVLITFEKHRDDETFGKALQSFELRWDRGVDGRPDWWAVDVAPSETKTWALRPHTNNEYVSPVDEAYIRDNFYGREAKIILYLAMAILKGKPRVQRNELDRLLDVSGNTTLSVIDDLATKGSILVEGKGRGTRYTLSDKMTRLIIHE
jgi:hypothetical protein